MGVKLRDVTVRGDMSDYSVTAMEGRSLSKIPIKWKRSNLRQEKIRTFVKAPKFLTCRETAQTLRSNKRDEFYIQLYPLDDRVH